MRPVLDACPIRYVGHPLHGDEREWAETSCSLDAWIEVLHTLDLDPVAALASTLSADFMGDQWRFLKFPPEDLRLLFGIAVDELAVWQSLLDHVDHYLSKGQLLTVEVDSWFLPDTVARAYRTEHMKSTIVPNFVDRASRRLEYFHGAGYYELAGDDFNGIFSANTAGDGRCLPPYVEVIRLDRIIRSDILPRAIRLAQSHLARRPAENPVDKLGHQIEVDQQKISQQNANTFHRYTFANLRQLGATAELAGSFSRWLSDRSGIRLDHAADCFVTVAREAKSLQYKLSRLTRGRHIEIQPAVAVMAGRWADGIADIATKLILDAPAGTSEDGALW